MTNGNEPSSAIIITRKDGTTNAQSIGLTKRELMAIEFTKTLLGLRHYDNQPVHDISKGYYSSYDPMAQYSPEEEANKSRQIAVDLLTEKALFVADELIKALNKP